MTKIHKHEPKHRPRSMTVCPASSAHSPARRSGRGIARDAHAAGIPRLSNRLDGTGRVVEDQFRRRGLRSLRPAEMPLTTSPMDGLVTSIRDALHPRRHGL